MKKCIKCGQEKPLVDFYNDRRRSDKKQSKCKDCERTVQKLDRDNLSTNYVMGLILKKSIRLDRTTLKQYPELVETEKALLKLNRLIRQKLKPTL